MPQDYQGPQALARFGSRRRSIAILAIGMIAIAVALDLISYERHFPLTLGLFFSAVLLLAAALILYLRDILNRQELSASLVRARTAELTQAERRYHSLFSQSREGLILYDHEGRVIDINPAAADMLGYGREEALRLSFRDLMPEVEYQTGMDTVRSQVLSQDFSDFDERQIVHKDGTTFPVNVRVWSLKDASGSITGFCSWVQDITDHKRLTETLSFNQMRLESLLRISQYRSRSVQDLLDFALHEALALTASAIGYIYHYDETTRVFTLNTWSKDVMQACTIQDPKTRYDLDKTGIWGEAVRQRGYILLNDFQTAHPLKRGYPEGHAHLKRFLTIPIFSQDQIVAVVGVANKQDPYAENDVRQLTLLMHSVWQVTERRRAEDALHQSEARYRSLFENNHAVMLIIDPQSAQIVDANPAACIYYGYALEQLRAMQITDINTLTREEVFQEMERARAEERHQFFFTHRLASGETRFVEVFSGPIELGSRSLLFSIVHDITARRLAEESVRQNQQRLQHILEDLPLATSYSDDTGRIEFSNRTFQELFGYTRAEVPTIEAWFAHAYPDHDYRSACLARWNADATRARARNTRIGPGEYIVTAKDGGKHICEITGTFLDQGVLAIFNDITERKLAEETLKQSEERIRIQFKSIPVPTLVWKSQGGLPILTDYNDAALDFSKRTIADQIGLPVTELYDDMPQIAADIERCATERLTIENEFWYSLKGMRERKYVAVKYAFVPPDQVLMHINDVTLQKLAEEHLQYISIHDSLTGLYNRFYADAEIERLASSRKFPVSIIMVDLDGLKTVNDREGHGAGDMYIKAASSVLKQTFRPEDMIARIGGDEFLVILPAVDESVCAQSVGRLRTNLEIANAHAAGLRVEFSVGAATAHAGDELQNCIRLSDNRMYADKAAQKNLKTKR